MNDKLNKSSIPAWRLEDIHVTTGNKIKSTATVTLIDILGESVTKTCQGEGPMDASFKAIGSIVNVPNRILSFNIHPINKGIGA